MQRGSRPARPVHECIAGGGGHRFLFPARIGAGLAWTRAPSQSSHGSMEELLERNAVLSWWFRGPPLLAHLLATELNQSPESTKLRADATGLPWNNRWGCPGGRGSGDQRTLIPRLYDRSTNDSTIFFFKHVFTDMKKVKRAKAEGHSLLKCHKRGTQFIFLCRAESSSCSKRL
ncbi:hypothetical protein GQ55_2G404200 [Panicum hallii var. hallii]|uniref:Uncharacterized protein n=1 Tax=Panicum hallii var. hallii TaxID=1504633 RepID=A0A2T7EXK5_9POAL|nr:hypothetical protein GQ55_2G404200 [Panicum hallii var. hallii]